MQQHFWKTYLERKECFRQLVINHFKDTGRITDYYTLFGYKIANNLISLKHSGFNINNSIRIMANNNKAREALAQYTSPPLPSTQLQ